MEIRWQISIKFKTTHKEQQAKEQKFKRQRTALGPPRPDAASAQSESKEIEDGEAGRQEPQHSDLCGGVANIYCQASEVVDECLRSNWNEVANVTTKS